MTYGQSRDLTKIIKRYGSAAQIDMAIEECSELTKALLKSRRNGYTNEAREAVIDEIADVMVMVEQLKIIFDCAGEVEERIDYKINRQLERMKADEQSNVIG